MVFYRLLTFLREKENDPELLLCDYFDLIGGTSTGSIIAAGLSIGMTVDELKDKYMELGGKIFGDKINFWNPLETFGINRTFAYQVDQDFNLTDKENDINKLAGILTNAKKSRSTDSPLYDMINGISFQNSVAHEKTDVFRDKVRYDETIKNELAYARSVYNEDQSKLKPLRIYKDKFERAYNAGSWMFGTTKANLEKIFNFRIERNENTLELEKFIGLFN